LPPVANWFHSRPRFTFADELSFRTQQDVLSYSAGVAVNAGILLCAGVCLIVSFLGYSGACCQCFFRFKARYDRSTDSVSAASRVNGDPLQRLRAYGFANWGRVAGAPYSQSRWRVFMFTIVFTGGLFGCVLLAAINMFVKVRHPRLCRLPILV
jgi:hypothetical protein